MGNRAASTGSRTHTLAHTRGRKQSKKTQTDAHTQGVRARAPPHPLGHTPQRRAKATMAAAAQQARGRPGRRHHIPVLHTGLAPHFATATGGRSRGKLHPHSAVKHAQGQRSHLPRAPYRFARSQQFVVRTMQTHASQRRRKRATPSTAVHGCMANRLPRTSPRVATCWAVGLLCSYRALGDSLQKANACVHSC